MVFTATIFGCSLVGLFLLFAVKYWELSHARTLMPDARLRADHEALRLRDLLLAAVADMEKLPSLFLHALQVTLHAAAVDLGHLAHRIGASAHQMADRVSHRRHFERRETRSEFLKKVSEHKSGGDSDAPTMTV